MKELLGGKGANLAEMSRIGLPVPPGFTITTEVCTEYHNLGKDKVINLLRREVNEDLKFMEEIMGSTFGDPQNPLLLSVRSGARASMPGMMDTVLDIGSNNEVVEIMAQKTGKSHFVWDSYRRFIQMYGDVVMRVNEYTDDHEDVFEVILAEQRDKKGVQYDRDLSTEDLKELVEIYKKAIRDIMKKDFPQDPKEQFWNSVMAVFESWHTPRATFYRKLNNIPEDWGTAVNVQAMVFGNMGEHSSSGVAFTRDAATGEDIFNGEYLVDAQGEDVVAGIRTPLQITREGSQRWARLAQIAEEDRLKDYPSLEEYMPEVYKELLDHQQKLEDHFRDMQDIEFTIQETKLWILQTRTGKRTGLAMLNIGMDMLDAGMIDEKTLFKRITPSKIDELLHPVFDFKELKTAKFIAKGLPASPGAATGQIVFFSDDATKWKADGKDVILVRIETSADDLQGMDAARAIVTARGGMTSHAAVVARGMGKCCVSGAGSLKVDYKRRKLYIDGKVFSEGDWISADGTHGKLYEGKVKTKTPEISSNFERLMKMAESHARLKVHANADTPENARIARKFGAVGIGLCRTEHMFFGEERIRVMREMIMADTETGRRTALNKLLPFQRSDFESILEIMQGYPVTIRLLDPPLHEFLPVDDSNQKYMAEILGISVEEVKEKVEHLQEVNPMLGHRGCRLGNTYPEITEMQVRAIIEAALNLKRRGIKAIPEIMIPLTSAVNELKMQVHIAEEEIRQVFDAYGDAVEYKVGTMICISQDII